MYEVFYNFRAEPFRLSPDHKFCYEHKSYAKARAYMAYAFKRAEGFVMITGRPGTGKTTLIGELVESLSKDKVCTANLVCTQLQADDLLKTVAYSFGIGSTGVDKAEMLQRLTILLHRWHREGRRALLIVDEAQDLSSSAMEELRLLTNIQIGGQPLLQIFLVGQPELRDLILSPEMEQVHQRIVAASHIDGLGIEETEAYVLHRLSVVGWRGDPAIDRAIFPLIHKYSEGVPRRINLICSRLFLLGSVEQRHDIRAQDVRVVITELQAENLAAGTGISHEDFDQFNEPEWVTVPQPESQAQAAPPLHAVDTEQIVTDQATSEGSRDAKKKALQQLISHPDDIVDEPSATLGASTVYFEDEPEYDHQEDRDPFGNSLRFDPDSATTYGLANRSQAAATTGIEPLSHHWRRPVLLACLSVALLTLAVLAAYLFNRDSASQVPLDTMASSGVNQATAPMAHGTDPGLQTDVASNASESPFQVNVEINQADVSPASNPAEIQAESAPIAEANLPDGLSTELSTQVVAARQHALGSTAISSAEEEEVAEGVESADAVDELSVPANELPVSEALHGSTISVNFAFDSDDLLPESHVALDQAAVLLRENPQSIAAITGFTDKQGDEDYNLMLSRRRADAVREYLVNAGIEEERLHVEGRGVLSDAAMEHLARDVDSLEPYRLVKIELSGDRRL